MQIQVDTNRRVLQYGQNLGEREGATLEELNDAQGELLRVVLSQPNGGVTITKDHKTVNALPVTAPDPAYAAAEVERTTARDELATTYQTAVRRLDELITNGGTYTATQTRDAVIDLARIQRRALRLLRVMVA